MSKKILKYERSFDLPGCNIKFNQYETRSALIDVLNIFVCKNTCVRIDSDREGILSEWDFVHTQTLFVVVMFASIAKINSGDISFSRAQTAN